MASSIQNKTDLKQFNLYAEEGDLASLQHCVHQGFSVPKKGGGALFLSARHNHLNCVRYLIEQGAALDFQQSALYVSALNGHYDVVYHLLTQTSIDPYFENHQALRVSLHHGHFHVARLLIEQGDSIDVGLKTVQNLLHLLPPSFQGYFDFLQWLQGYQSRQQEQTLLMNEISMSPQPPLMKGRL